MILWSRSDLLNGQQMLEVREPDVGTLLEVEDLDPDEALRDGGDKVTVESNNTAEVQVYQEPSKNFISFINQKPEVFIVQQD